MHMERIHAQSAFSLVELSIVLVILGLLTGGILGGQALIRAAELRAVSTEYNRYVTAVQTFRDKYFALPGDMRNATSFWGDNNTQCPDAAITNGNPGTCNGNGDNNWGVANEQFLVWQHLANAGLIEGTYTGITGTANADDYEIPGNAPLSKLSNSGWAARSAFNHIGDVDAFAADYGNMFHLGAIVANGVPNGPNLKPEELWNIDTKMDDGRPGYGKVQARFWNDCTFATSVTDISAAYDLANSGKVCSIHFLKVN